jgi:hypothetical protein
LPVLSLRKKKRKKQDQGEREGGFTAVLRQLILIMRAP